jgi:hypothetical protein
MQQTELTEDDANGLNGRLGDGLGAAGEVRPGAAAGAGEHLVSGLGLQLHKVFRDGRKALVPGVKSVIDLLESHAPACPVGRVCLRLDSINGVLRS